MIYALATAPGRAGVAVVRLSGGGAGIKEAIERLTGQPPPEPRRAALRVLSMPDDEIIDHALVLYFPAPKSFTGEDVVEFHIHGGQAVLAALMAACQSISGLRPAEAGEFSRRAFLNGRCDLAEIEGLADLVAAETSAQRRQALRQMGGAMSALYEGWRHDLLGLLAQAEARLDFPEEIDEISGASACEPAAGAPVLTKINKININKINKEILFHLDDDQRGERLRSGVHIAIAGAPNVGKSTLLNLLAGRDAAITSAQAGTTRDILQVSLDLDGWPIVISDMAGLRETKDDIEAEGVRRAQAVSAQADLRLIMLAADMGAALNGRALSLARPGDLIIVNKTDLSCAPICRDADIRLSLSEGKQTKGFAQLMTLLTERAASLCGGAGGGSSPLITRARHRAALAECQQALSRASQAALPELLAEDLRLAMTALGRITGRADVENMLDRLFAEFCIGK